MADVALTSADNEIGRRANARARLMLPAMLMLPGSKEKGWLENISRTGARVRMQNLPSVGSTAIFKFANFELWCTVAWTRGSNCGLCFDAPLPRETVTRLRSFSDNYEEHKQTHSESVAKSWVSGQLGHS